MAGCPSGVAGACEGNGWAVQMVGGSHNLIEYNETHRVGDFINVHTPYSIIRNNYMHDFRNDYWPDGSGSLHCDMFQPYAESQYQVYESNFMGDNIEYHSHILQMRIETTNDEMHYILFRGNVGYNHGSYAMQSGGVDNVYYYNNTIHNINTQATWAAPATYYNAEGVDNSLNNHNFNNIYTENQSGGPPISVGTGCTCSSSNNLCFETGSHASCVSTSNPLFSDSGSHDYHLQSDSPAIGLGKAITTVTSPNGQGSSFDVSDGGFFSDGHGIAEGDIIKVGSNDPVRITQIVSNTISVDSDISWSHGDGVFWRHQDGNPDAGAYEYRSEGYDFGIEIQSPFDGANVRHSVEIRTTPTNSDCIRFVMFYVDGIPVFKDFESPYAYTWNPADLEEDSLHRIEARAYALYATTGMVESDIVNVRIGDPAPPLDLKIKRPH
jgi:hypothetical protein